MRERKAQHEIVGFILIVVIVVVVGLFMLVFYLRQEPIRYESLEVQNFLQSSMLYTTECSISTEPMDLQELIKTCHKGGVCSNNKVACFVLNETISELVHQSWRIGSERPMKAYLIDIYYEEGIKETILRVSDGNCSGSKSGAEYLIHQYPGDIIASMEICYI
jgi:hypothetical protein